MSPRYEPRRIAANRGVPWRPTSGGLRIVDLADVTPKPKEPVDELDENGYPVLDAYERNDGYGLAVWCRYCRKWHVHGHGAGHRAEHCHKEDSPYLKPVMSFGPSVSRCRRTRTASHGRRNLAPNFRRRRCYALTHTLHSLRRTAGSRLPASVHRRQFRGHMVR